MGCTMLACLLFIAVIPPWEMVVAQQPFPTSTPPKSKCGKIKTSYDKSLDKTTVQLFPRLIYGTIFTGVGTGITSEPERPTKTLGEPPEVREPKGLMMQIFLTYPGKSPSVPRNIAFLFTSQDTSPRYYNKRGLVAEIDGKEVKLGDADLVQSREEDYSFSHPLAGGAQYTKEVLGIAVPFQLFEQMSNAKTLTLKLNKTEIPFGHCEIEALQNLISQVKPL